MNRLKVLHIQHFVYPWRFPLFAELGGRYDLDVFFCRAKRGFRRWDTTIPDDRNFRGKILRAVYLGPLTFNPGIFRLLRKKYDVYSVAALDRINFLQFVATLLVAKLRKKPFIMVDEFLVTDYYRSKRKLAYVLNLLVRKTLYPHIDAFVLWNNLARQFVVSVGVPEKKVFCGPQILSGDEGGFTRAADENCAMDELSQCGNINILYVGNLIERKAPDILVRAFRQVQRHDIHLLMVGDGPCLERLKVLADGDTRVRFLGHLDGQDKREIFRKAHIFVLPSLHEPWGFVINEALEWGLPVITTSAVGAADYLVRGNGMVLPPGDVEALRAAVARMVADRDTLKEMSKVSKWIAAELTVADMAEPFFNAVNLVIGSSSSKAGDCDGKTV